MGYFRNSRSRSNLLRKWGEYVSNALPCGIMGKYHPFLVTSKEVRCSEDAPEKYHLFRVFDFAMTLRASILTGSLNDNYCLEATLYRATI